MKLLVVVALLGVWSQADAQCVMYGECQQVNGFWRSCAYDPPISPRPLIEEHFTNAEREEIIGILENRCPHLLYDDEGNRIEDHNVFTCCNAEQVRKFSDGLMLAEGILGRCPACLQNFAIQICEMNCAQDQVRFVDVVTVTGDNGPYVEEVNYHVHEDFMVAAHASCSGVIVPQTGMPAINLMCGNAAVCDADAWFGFTGDTSSNPLAPVQVNFLRWPTAEDSMNVSALACTDTPDGALPCSCVDCSGMCPTGNEPVIQDTCSVLTLNCISFSVGIAFFIVSIIVFTVLTFKEIRKKRAQASQLDNKPENYSPPKDNALIKVFQCIFSKLGGFCASNPWIVIMLTTWLAFGMFFGVANLRFTTNPIELWSAPHSRSRQELNYFNSRFGPFYRAAQVYLRVEGMNPFEANNVTYGPAFHLEAINELVALENAILNIGRDDGGVVLEQVCYSPLRARGSEQRLDQCVSMSVSTYLPDRDNIRNDTYLTSIQNCLNNYLALNCLATWGGGADPELAFGGYEGDNVLSADTLLINYPIANHLLREDLAPVLEWEQRFLDVLRDYEENWKSDFITVSYAAERSIEDEIQRVSVAEATPIAISYVLMFIYVIISLGNSKSWRTWFIDSKIAVAVGSIVVVLISIFCAMGTMGFFGITATLLAVNVIPFFVLSVGIDNVFLMVNAIHDIEQNLKEYDDYRENFSFEKKRKFLFSKMLGKVGPSIFMTSSTQITCFAIGSLTNFPAVVTFSVFATLSLVFLFFLQVTAVVAILSLDYKRTQQSRFDVFCCIRKKILDDVDPLQSGTPYQSVTTKLMGPYSKFLLTPKIKMVVVVIFMAVLVISVMFIPSIEIGLDQQMALPTDSYVYRYLESVNHLLRLGPPVYFVLKRGLNFTNTDHQNVICGGQLCHTDSLSTQIFLASLHSNITYIQRSSNSWLDDFIDWASLPGTCCQVNTTSNGFCLSTDTSGQCSDCVIDRDPFGNGLRPNRAAFERFIPFFLQDPPNDVCTKGGLASYAGSVNYYLDSEERATVVDSNFMAYHSALSTSYDFITALSQAYDISANITTSIRSHTGLDVEVFPYSVFYVFYEQYLTMWSDTFASIGYSILGAAVINLIASGFNLIITFAVMTTALMVVLNMMGVMYLWSIPLNAVSCVNLIVSIGIAVEFCSHIAFAYSISKSPAEQRIPDALKAVGSTIITGITFTNIPIVVLAFSYTEIIEVFFFRMFFSIVVLGLLHGMVFFPVFLSYLDNLRTK